MESNKLSLEKELNKACNELEKEVNSSKDENKIGMWKYFSQTTGFHGLNKITFESQERRKIVQSVCWVFVWLTCAVFLIYTVITELKNYYSYPTTSNTFIELNERLPFPAVTICNMSPKRRDYFKTDAKTTNLYMKTSALNWASVDINWSDPFYRKEGYFNTTHLSDIVAQSKDLKDFAFMITFDGREMNEFLPVYTDMGLCLRFNAEGTVYTSKHGAMYNLHVYLNVMTYYDYFSHMLSSGVKIAVHDPQIEPIMINEGIVLQPGTEGYIEIRRNEYKFLPEPYTAFGNKTCVDRPNYSSNNCHLKCWNAIIKETCGCTDFLSNNDTFCSYRDYLECSNPIFCKLRLHTPYPTFSNLGGQLGLFLGASILTLTELLEFIIILVWSAGIRCYQRKGMPIITPLHDPQTRTSRQLNKD